MDDMNDPYDDIEKLDFEPEFRPGKFEQHAMLFLSTGAALLIALIIIVTII